MTKIIEDATRNGNDYKFPIGMINELAEELAKRIIGLAFLPQTKELVATLANGENIKAAFTEATASDTGLMPAAMFQKLEGIAKGAQVNSVTSVNNQTGAVNLGKADVGLDKVNNTADNEKSVHYATTSGAAAAADRAVSDANGNNIANTYLAKTGTAASASKLSNTQKINGVSFDGQAAVNYGGICTTAADVAAKTVSIANYTLTDYSTICVMFQEVNTAANPTLNVNGTGSKSIYWNNSSSTSFTTAPRQPVILQYYNNAWRIAETYTPFEVILQTVPFNFNELQQEGKSGIKMYVTAGNAWEGTTNYPSKFTAVPDYTLTFDYDFNAWVYGFQIAISANANENMKVAIRHLWYNAKTKVRTVTHDWYYFNLTVTI